MGLLLSILYIMRFGITGIKNFIVSGVRLGRGEALFLGLNPNTIGMDCAFAGVITFYFFIIKKDNYHFCPSAKKYDQKSESYNQNFS